MTTSPVKIIGKNVKIQPSRRKSDDSTGAKNNISKNGRTQTFKSPINKLFSNKNSKEGIGSKVMKLVKNPLGGSNKKKLKKGKELNSSSSKSASEPCLSSTSSSNSSSKENRVSNLSLASSSTSSSSTKRKKSKKSWPKKKRNTIKPEIVERSSPNPRLENNQQLVFPLDVKTQMTRLVTPRQRQEVYALNRIMTRLENEKFNRLLMDRNNPGSYARGDEILDIFM